MSNRRRNNLSGRRTKQEFFLLLLFSVSLLFFILNKILPVDDKLTQRIAKIKASEVMKEAIDALPQCLEEKNLILNQEFDINSTGLIGFENSGITTTLGDLAAKRTTTNPNMGALMVHLLYEAGVKEGDAVAVGASGSFPALMIAAMSAAKALNLHPIIICSLGASQWGANRTDFHLLKMFDCLTSTGVFDFQPAAVSLGGEKDVGEGMSKEAKDLLLRDIDDSGVLFILEEALQDSVQKRMQVFDEHAGEKGLKGFINIGGNWSNIGTSSEVLNLKPGLVRVDKVPPIENRGLIFEMARRQIPVIHLLYIRGLVEMYGLPWDPIPLPEVGKGGIFRKAVQYSPLFLLLAAAYISVVAFILSWYRKTKKII